MCYLVGKGTCRVRSSVFIRGDSDVRCPCDFMSCSPAHPCYPPSSWAGLVLWGPAVEATAPSTPRIELRDWRRRCGQGLCSCLAQNSTGEAELGQSGRRAARVLESSGARMALSKDLPMFFKGRRKEWRRTFPRSWTQHICLYHWPELGHMTIPGCKESSWIIYSGWPFAKLKWETPSLKKKVRRNIRRILAV